MVGLVAVHYFELALQVSEVVHLRLQLADLFLDALLQLEQSLRLRRFKVSKKVFEVINFRSHLNLFILQSDRLGLRIITPFTQFF